MGDLIIPYCSQCFREVVNFDCFVETPCKHCYCWKCITGRRDCPIDHTAWDPQSMVYSDELKEAVETFSTWKNSASLEKVYELINVNGVECRLAGNRKHNRTPCHYHHPTAKVDNSLESWECPNCKITVSAQSQMCGFCNCLKPSVPANGQEWACSQCTALNSMETYVCSACAKTNTEIRSLLRSQGKNMKLCPKCKKSVPFSAQTCTFCATPIIDPALNPTGPYWTCSNCGSKCQQMDSWICDNCAKTDIPQRQKLKNEGKEMNHCPNCKKLVPCSLTQCWSCYVLIPRKCGACGNNFTSEKCENCETRRQTRSSRSPTPKVATRSTERSPGSPLNTFNPVPAKPLSSIAKAKSQGKIMELCPNCRNEVPISNQICTFCATPIIDPALNPTGPYWTCSNCGSKCQQMDSWICDNCAKPDIPQRQKLRNEGKEMNSCPNCKKLVTYNRYQCDSCSALVPRRCGACGLDYSAEKCDNCEARRKQRSSRSPKPRTSEKLYSDSPVSVMKHPNPPSQRRGYTQPVSRGRENPVVGSENQFLAQRQNPAPIYSEPLFSASNYPARNRHRGDRSIENMRREDLARNIDAPMYDRSEALPDNRIVIFLILLVLAFLLYYLYIGRS